MLATPSLGRVMDDSKCKCLMCVCDVDPHPLPPELPSHHHPAPPEEPEPEPTPVYHYPPPHAEPAPVYYLPPPGQPAYGGQYPYPSQGQSPVLGIVGTPTVMYPQYIRAAPPLAGAGATTGSVRVSLPPPCSCPAYCH
uniref:Uncharacterized protein n=1 Tax=Oryza brachyantha TaxID=4533 RepID=J3L1Q8_ORYBR